MIEAKGSQNTRPAGLTLYRASIDASLIGVASARTSPPEVVAAMADDRASIHA